MQQNNSIVSSIEICMGSSCYCRGNKTLAAEIKEMIAFREWEGLVEIRGCLCRDACATGAHIFINGSPCTIRTTQAIEHIIEEQIAKIQR